MHARSKNAVISRGLAPARAQHTSVEGVETLQLHDQNACQGFKCPKFQTYCVHPERLSDLLAWFQKRPFWTNVGPDRGGPLVNKTRLFSQSIYRERTNIEHV